MKSKLVPAVLLLALCCVPLRAGPSDNLVVPGQSVGPVHLGMEHAAVLRLLGVPHREDDLSALPDSENGPYRDIIRDDWITPLPVFAHPESAEGVFMADFVTVYFKHQLVVQVEVRTARFKTAEGLSSASTPLQWRARFPRSKETSHTFRHPSSGGWPGAKHITLLEDAVAEGIAWRWGAMGSNAPDPDPERQVEVICVHAPGRPVLMDPDGGSRFIWKTPPLRSSKDY